MRIAYRTFMTLVHSEHKHHFICADTRAFLMLTIKPCAAAAAAILGSSLLFRARTRALARLAIGSLSASRH